MALTPTQKRRQKEEKQVLKMLSEYEAKGMKTTKAVAYVAERLSISERRIFLIIKSSKDEQSKQTES